MLVAGKAMAWSRRHGRLATHAVLVVRTLMSSRRSTPSGPSLSMRVSSVLRSSALSWPSRPDRIRRSEARAYRPAAAA